MNTVGNVHYGENTLLQLKKKEEKYALKGKNSHNG
jgi:hypothetical protein